MEPLVIVGDKITPHINFNAKTGLLAMGGLAIPEDVRTMFAPVKKWIEEYSDSPMPATELALHFEYLNTSATRMLFEICSMISDLHAKENCRVKITWQYNRGDAEMRELGEEMIDEFICLTEIVAVD
jgi:hypothetical protein